MEVWNEGDKTDPSGRSKLLERKAQIKGLMRPRQSVPHTCHLWSKNHYSRANPTRCQGRFLQDLGKRNSITCRPVFAFPSKVNYGSIRDFFGLGVPIRKSGKKLLSSTEGRCAAR